MKETLDEQSRQALVNYRLQRAEETLEEVCLMADAGHYNAAVNRMYYACYYATIALFLKHHISASTHAGVKTMLGLHFISKGIIANQYGQTFNTLFEKRHSGDYDDFIYCDKAMVEELYPKVEEYIKMIKEIL